MDIEDLVVADYEKHLGKRVKVAGSSAALGAGNIGLGLAIRFQARRRHARMKGVA